MSKIYFMPIRKTYTFILLLVMSATVIAQEIPSVDKMKSSAGNVEIHFVGHGSLMFKFNELIVQVDPVRSSGKYDAFPKADLILVTHEHGDHLDAKLLEEIKKDGTILFSNKASALKVPWAKIMQAGEKQDFKSLKIEAVEAYNIVNERAPGQPFHPKGSGLGFIITFGDTRFYIAGDTENIPEMKSLKAIDVAFLPMNLPYTMTPAMVADAALAFKPRILYPYHYGDTDTNELVKLLKGTETTVLIRNLK